MKKILFQRSRPLLLPVLTVAWTVLFLQFRPEDPAYAQQLAEWHNKRIQSLKSETGWLNLAGLFWLHDGVNTAGANPAGELIFPVGKAPASLGTFTLTDGKVWFEPAAGVGVMADGSRMAAGQPVFGPELTKPVQMAYQSLRWFVIKRGTRYAVRLRDLDSPFLTGFKGIDRFPANEKYRIQAKLLVPAVPKTIPILDVTGQTSQQPLVGTLQFKLDGKPYSLDAVAEGDELFIIFGDATNDHETYGAGRFLYAARPGSDGMVTLDFNKATNPPCAFTPYATCPLPPKQNKLPVAIPAGEKRYGDH